MGTFKVKYSNRKIGRVSMTARNTSSVLKPTANWSPYIFTLVQKGKHGVYKIHVFFQVKQYFAETLQIISFKNDVYFLHGRS